MKTLLIGGPWDGRRVDLAPGTPDIRVQEIMPCSFSANERHAEPKTYRYDVVCMKPDLAIGYSCMSITEAMRRLIDAYPESKLSNGAT